MYCFKFARLIKEVIYLLRMIKYGPAVYGYRVLFNFLYPGEFILIYNACFGKKIVLEN